MSQLHRSLIPRTKERFTPSEILVVELSASKSAVLSKHLDNHRQASPGSRFSFIRIIGAGSLRSDINKKKPSVTLFIIKYHSTIHLKDIQPSYRLNERRQFGYKPRKAMPWLIHNHSRFSFVHHCPTSNAGHNPPLIRYHRNPNAEPL